MQRGKLVTDIATLRNLHVRTVMVLINIPNLTYTYPSISRPIPPNNDIALDG